MSRAQRVKGRRAEAEVAAIWTAAGFTVRGLEGAGDHLVIGYGLTIHSEVKRQEVLRLPLWTRQAVAEAPRGALPVVAYRRSRERWRALLPLKWLEHRGLYDRPHGLFVARVLLLNGEHWADVLLLELAEKIAAGAAA